jgi:hypothetical protein
MPLVNFYKETDEHNIEVKYRVYHLKCNSITYYGTKLKSEAGPHHVIDCPQHSQSRSP